MHDGIHISRNAAPLLLSFHPLAWTMNPCEPLNRGSWPLDRCSCSPFPIAPLMFLFCQSVWASRGAHPWHLQVVAPLHLCAHMRINYLGEEYSLEILESFLAGATVKSTVEIKHIRLGLLSIDDDASIACPHCKCYSLLTGIWPMAFVFKTESSINIGVLQSASWAGSLMKCHHAGDLD